MIYKKLRNGLRGSVRVTVECAMPERVLNLCAVHGVPFWDLTWIDEIHFTLCTTRKGARQLQELAPKASAHIALGQERGVPAAAQRLRRRYVLLGALAIFFALVWYGNTFVWMLEVSGNDTVPTHTVLRALERQGVRAGIRATAIDQDVLRNHVLLEIPDLSWLAVNVTGCTAHVQVVERHRPGELVKDTEYRDVVACRDGLVVKVEALRGRAQVAPGDTVTVGQKLISGRLDDVEDKSVLTNGMGRIYARTWYTLTLREPLSYERKLPAEGRHTRWAVDIGKKRIKFPRKGCTFRENCDKITLYQNLSLPLGMPLPITWVKETYETYETVIAQRSVTRAQALAEQDLLRQLREEMTPGGEIVSTDFTAEQQGDVLTVTLTAECYEDIAENVPIG